MMPKPELFAWEEGFSSHWVKEEEVLGVIEGEAMSWPKKKGLKEDSDARNG